MYNATVAASRTRTECWATPLRLNKTHIMIVSEKYDFKAYTRSRVDIAARAETSPVPEGSVRYISRRQHPVVNKEWRTK